MAADLYGSVAFALGAGVATFFAPCAYALLPGYVGYYVATTDAESPPLPDVFLRGGAAGLGALATTAVLAGFAVYASDVVADVLPALELLVGVGLVALGGLVVVGWTGSVHLTLPERRSSVVGFAGFGAVYAVAAAACVLPVFLSIVLQTTTLSPPATVAVVGAYGGAVAVLLLATTVAIAVGHDSVLSRIGTRAGWLTRAAGVLLVLAGLGQIAVALGYV